MIWILSIDRIRMRPQLFLLDVNVGLCVGTRSEFSYRHPFVRLVAVYLSPNCVGEIVSKLKDT